MLSRPKRADRVEDAGLQVTRRRRRAASGRRPGIVALGVTAGVLAAAGVTYASTEVFGHNQVGTEYANGIQVSDNQLIKPYGERLLTRSRTL